MGSPPASSPGLSTKYPSTGFMAPFYQQSDSPALGPSYDTQKSGMAV